MQAKAGPGTASVQVAVRLRPMSAREDKDGTLAVVTASVKDNEVTIIRGAGNRQQKQVYNFDAVFPDIASQQDIFESVSPLVDDVLSGFEGTVFAYGQTGTGKTHTMEGDLTSDNLKGVIPRAVEAIFDQLNQAKYTASSVSASYLEIYNEELSDLLEDSVTLVTPRPGFGGNSMREAAAEAAPKLRLIDDRVDQGKNKGKGMHVAGLSEHKVASSADVLKLIQRAQERRKVGETKMNKLSSRSHCVFTLSVASTRTTADGGSMECSGKLHLVDLAGSECAKTAGGDTKTAMGEARERERRNINQSLLTLGRVISTLRENMTNKTSDSGRIPYRDSKLTRLLQESLGGRCKTVIIATLSPSVLAVDESFSTLNYAQQAHGIQNKPVATSYLKVGEGYGMEKGEGAGGEGTTVQDWHVMQCRLQYMQSQMENAQAALAKKQLQQEALEKRAAEAEKARATAQEAFEKKEAEAEQLKADNAIKQKELDVKAFLLDSRSRTEAKLSTQATTVLSCLVSTEAEAADLHASLTAAVDAIDTQAARRDAYSSGLATQLADAKASLNAFGLLLAEQRDAALDAAAKAEAAAAEHASTLATHAASLAETADGELGRSATALEAATADAGAKLSSACTSLAEGATSMASKASAAQADVATKLEAVSASLAAAQGALSTTVDTSVGRQAAAEEEAAVERSSIVDAIRTAAADVASRLDAERQRLASHGGALRELLAEVAKAKGLETKAREALSALKEQEAAGSDAAASRLQACTDALVSASDAQKAAQPDADLLASLEQAGKSLAETREGTNSTLATQGANLTSALAAQSSGNAAVATAAALSGARKAVDDASAGRIAHVEKAAAALTSQQAGLKTTLAQQESLRAELLKEVMGGVEALLEAKLAKLADGAAAGIAAAVAASEEVAGVGEASAAATAAAQTAYAEQSDSMLATTKAWGASNDAVGAQITEAIASAEVAQAALVEGEKTIGASHAAVKGHAGAWADADAACRGAIGNVAEMNGAAAAASSAQYAAQASAIDAVDGLAAKLEVASDEASAAIKTGEAEVGACTAQLGDAKTANGNVASLAASKLEQLGKSSEAARKVEAEALAALAAAASAATASATGAIDAASATGNDAAAALSAAAADAAATATAAAAEQVGVWEAHGASEAAARSAALESLRGGGEAANAAASAHTAAAESAKAARDASTAAQANAQQAAVSAQSSQIEAMAADCTSFVAESDADPTAVAERDPQPFTEPFARTAPEEELREHFAANGPVPLEGVGELPQIEPPSPRARLVPSPRATPKAGTPAPKAGTPLPKSATPKVGGQENASAPAFNVTLPAPRLSTAISETAALSALTVPELKKLCDEHSIPQKGKKKQEMVELLAKCGAKVVAATPRSTPRRGTSDPTKGATKLPGPPLRKSALGKSALQVIN